MVSREVMRVYIAGPYTLGDVAVNVRTAIEAGQRVLDAGHSPYIPHLTHFWHLLFPAPAQQWYDHDLIWLRQCEAMIRLPGESKGADQEEAQAEFLGIPVYRSVSAFLLVSKAMWTPA